MGRIRFTVNYEVKLRRTVESYLDRFQTEIGHDLIGLTIEKYWKIEEHFQAQFSIETDSVGKEHQTYDILRAANFLLPSNHTKWTINGPHEDGGLMFECVLNNNNADHPLKWACIELETA